MLESITTALQEQTFIKILVDQLFRFYVDRKYVNKNEKRRTCGCEIKRLGLFTTGRDIRQITRKK